jgi:hypothetical protein
MPIPICVGCNKRPEEINEYKELATEYGISPDAVVLSEEGTYNFENGHFLCTDCYVSAGMPSLPGGWICP